MSNWKLVFRIHDFIRKHSDLDCRNHYLEAIMIIFLDNIKQMLKWDIFNVIPHIGTVSCLKTTRIACLSTKAQQILLKLIWEKEIITAVFEKKILQPFWLISSWTSHHKSRTNLAKQPSTNSSLPGWIF